MLCMIYSSFSFVTWKKETARRKDLTCEAQRFVFQVWNVGGKFVGNTNIKVATELFIDCQV